MKLKELDLRPEQRIRICTEHGANFIYIGTAGDVDFEELNRTLYSRVRDRMRDAVNNYDKNKAPTVTAFDNVFQEFRFWVPVEEREVLDQYAGQYECDCLVIKITGRDGWLQYIPEAAPLDPATMDTDAAKELVAAIYKGLCQELIHAYETGSEDNIRRGEREIRANRYGLFDDPEGLIRGCKQRAGV